MEIVVGFVMFSLGMLMASRMYRHCVHPCQSSRSIIQQIEQRP
jgi:hypothetical protein